MRKTPAPSSSVGSRKPRPLPREAGRGTPAPAFDRPRVLINMAITADGKIASANRAVSSFGSRRDHDHLLELRATADAVLCGARTAGAENITLGTGPLRFRRQRLRHGLAEYNLRVVVSGSANLSPTSNIFSHRSSPILVLTTERAPASRRRRLAGVADEVVCFGTKDLDLGAALRWLRREWSVRRLVCEGGATLNDAMFRAGLVDEVHVTVCPVLFGGREAPTISEGAGFDALRDAAALKLRSRRRLGEEMFLIYDVASSPVRVSTQRAISQRTSESRLK